MSSESSDTEESIPSHLLDAAKDVTLNLLPEKSRRQYISTYDDFKKWQKSKKTSSFDEKVLLVYLDELSRSVAPPTLWARYSMLKATLQTYHDVNIGAYKNIIAFLKRKNQSYKPKKAKVFTPSEVSEFCSIARDEVYLLHKAILVIGICGACRREELTNITMKDVKDIDRKMLHITIPKTKTGVERSFTVVGDFYDICKDYMKLRPEKCKSDRFFLNFRNGHCTHQPVGINKIGAVPSVIAEYLKLPNPSGYTGHSFRRTSATLLVEAGGDITAVKKLRGWKSTTVAEGYIEASVAHKKKIAEQITNSISISVPSTSRDTFHHSSTLETTEKEYIPKHKQQKSKIPHTITSSSSLSTPSASTSNSDLSVTRTSTKIREPESKRSKIELDTVRIPEEWSQQPTASSVPDEDGLEELFSVPFLPDHEEWSQQPTVDDKELQDFFSIPFESNEIVLPREKSTTEDRLEDRSKNVKDGRNSFNFSNCSIKFVMN